MAAAVAAGRFEAQLRENEELQAIAHDITPNLKAQLENSQGAERVGVAQALFHFTQAAEPARTVLREALRSTDPQVRRAATAALGGMQEAAAPAVPMIANALRDTNHSVQLAALSALVRLGPVAKPAAPAVRQVLDEADDRGRAGLAVALWRITQDAAPTLDVLVVLLKHKDRVVRQLAASNVQTLGQAGAPARQALIVALDDPVERVRSAAVWALRSTKVADRETVAALRSVVGRNAGAERGPAALLLHETTGGAEPQLTRLIELATTGEEHARGSLVTYFGRLPDQAEIVFPHVLGALQDESPYVRGAAAGALRNVADHPARREKAISALLKLETDKVQYVREQASRAAKFLEEHRETPEPRQ